MIKKLHQIPKSWLDLSSCRTIYEVFSKKQVFKEPLSPFNDRYPGRLESILGSISQSFDGNYLYPTVLDAAAGYLFKLACEHPFYNGNKRVALLYTDVFLYLNGLQLTLPYEDLYHLVAFIAQSSEEKKYSEEELKEACKKIISDFTKETQLQ